MSLIVKLNKVMRFLNISLSNTSEIFYVLSQATENIRGITYGIAYKERTHEFSEAGPAITGKAKSNPLEVFFDNRKSGPGIWKWRHYFEIYNTHFKKFVGKKVNILEIGVFSGGSLDMWRDYFGEQCHIFGVDVDERCKIFENDHITIYIGDQEDRDFWSNFKSEVPQVDIVIDDGGHQFNQQIVTLEEMLPHLQPGGIYVCEDVHGVHNGFNSYCQGLTKGLNEMTLFDPRAGYSSGMRPNPLQAWIKGIHFYPYITVLEKSERPNERLIAPKHGTKWLPIKTT